MNALRVDSGEVSKQEKEAFVISCSISAIQCQRYTRVASTPLSTMSLRHQSGDWEGESARKTEGEGGRQKRKKQPRKKARKKRRTPKIPVFPLLFSFCHYSVIFPAEWASIIFSSQDINHFNLGTQKLQWFLIKNTFSHMQQNISGLPHSSYQTHFIQCQWK